MAAGDWEVQKTSAAERLLRVGSGHCLIAPARVVALISILEYGTRDAATAASTPHTA